MGVGKEASRSRQLQRWREQMEAAGRVLPDEDVSEALGSPELPPIENVELPGLPPIPGDRRSRRQRQEDAYRDAFEEDGR